MSRFSLNQQFEELVKTTRQEEQILNTTTNNNDKNNNNNNNINNNNNKITTEDESAKSLNFFQDNKSVKKMGKKYTTTCIKSRNFLSNISYMGINKKDFYNEIFVFDNPFSLDRKLSDQNKLEMIDTLWKECMPANFYKHICSQQNFFFINGKNILCPKVSEIINYFLVINEKNYVQLRNNLSQFKNLFPYKYSNVYPEIYCSTDRRGFILKSTFHIVFKADKDNKKEEHLGKNPQNYVHEHAVTSTFEQKSIEIDNFNEEEEKEVKERVEKRK